MSPIGVSWSDPVVGGEVGNVVTLKQSIPQGLETPVLSLP